MTSHNVLPNSDTETPFAEKVLRKINDERIVPRPRWVFSLRNRLLWIFAFLAVLIASVATAGVLFVLVHTDWHHALITHSTWAGLLMDSLPFMWISILILFSGIGYAHIHTTTYGYRYSLTLSIIGIAIAVCGLGTIFFISGFGRVVEEGAHTYLPWYESVLYEKQSWLGRQNEDIFFGKITMQDDTQCNLSTCEFYYQVNE